MTLYQVRRPNVSQKLKQSTKPQRGVEHPYSDMEYIQVLRNYYKTIRSLQLREELYKSQLKAVVTSRKAREINQSKKFKNEGQKPKTGCNMTISSSNRKRLYKQRENLVETRAYRRLLGKLFMQHDYQP